MLLHEFCNALVSGGAFGDTSFQGGNELASTAVIDFEIACLGQSTEISVYAHYNHSFVE
jgi:hypothetical protein